MTEEQELLWMLYGWLKDLGYKAPEIIEEERHWYVGRIKELLDIK